MIRRWPQTVFEKNRWFKVSSANGEGQALDLLGGHIEAEFIDNPDEIVSTVVPTKHADIVSLSKDEKCLLTT